MTLDPRIAADLKSTCDRLLTEARIRPQDALNRYRATFVERFGPQRLKGLDGPELLETMHSHGTKDSLVYWLEFKDDDEFPAIFGSIAGGSAFKFGVFRRKETGEWMTGSAQIQRVIGSDEAIQIARRHRDQLVAGAEFLQQFPLNGGLDDYRGLQRFMDENAPNVSNLAWGHKYFSLVQPEKIDDFHSPSYQRFHLVRFLQDVPSEEVRYLYGWWFVQIARELAMPMNWLTTSTNFRNGRPYSYWRVGTNDGAQSRGRWQPMREAGRVALGWPELGDLSIYRKASKVPKELKDAMAKSYSGQIQMGNRAAAQAYRFVAKLAENDLVVACDGAAVLGIGRVSGEYSYDSSSEFPHQRQVQWLNLDEWRMADPEGLQAPLHQMGRPANLLEIERRVLGGGPTPIPPIKPPPVWRLDGVAGRIQSVLDRKGQVILYGPPGTGKTYWAEKAAHDLAALDSFGIKFEKLADDQRRALLVGSEAAGPRVRACCFHPAYGYEDFLEGYRPEQIGGHLSFVLRPGVFRTLCRDAAADADHRYYLIIDEINRGDIPRIFGELLTLLEKNKRGKTLVLPVSGEAFQVPPNVFVIGTMNTADRSIALLDTALRRRFGFIELMPDSSLLESAVLEGIPLRGWLDALNRRICEYIGRDARNLQVGHSYLLEAERPVSDFSRLARVVHEEIIPLLEEYCYEDHEVLERILGSSLVDLTEHRVRHELFDAANQQQLIAALLAPCPEIQTSSAAVTADEGEDAALAEDADAEAEGS